MSELFIGLMSGTSVDAIDAVLMDFSSSNTQLVSSFSQTINPQLRNDINSLIATRQQPKDFQTLDHQFANASCQAIAALLKQSQTEANKIIAVGSHGQTVFHDPKGIPALSIQIGSPQIIANHTGIPSIGNFRQADIDAGGQGAPLACAYHAEVLHSAEEERVVLNLGGIANITKLPKSKNEPIIGFDTGPANTLMDAWTQKHLNKPYDENGAWAKSGKTNTKLLERMLEDSYFAAMPPKSTGREHFNIEWIEFHLENLGETVTAEDTQATLLALTTYTVADSIDAWCPSAKRILLCGGGSENQHLVEQLKTVLNETSIEQSNDYNAPSKWMEAMAFAWLAKQNIDNKPGNIPSVTGADKAVVLGQRFKPE